MNNTWFKVFRLNSNKSVEFEVTKTRMGFNIYKHTHINSRGIYFESNLCNVIGAIFDCNWRTDHAGVRVDITLFSWIFAVTFYDVRHWNDVEDCWETYDEIDNEYYLGKERDN